MKNYEEAYDEVMKIEGGYCNRKADAGGETYRGISRKYHPSWPGWLIIDREKINKPVEELDNILAKDDAMQGNVKNFYKKNYWDRLKLDDIPSYEITLKLFDMAVNCGVTRASKWLQAALNVLNRYGRDWEELIIDGKIGSTTVRVCNEAVDKRKDNILKALNILQGNLYIKLAQDPRRRDELNINGWLKQRIGFVNINSVEATQ